MITPGVLDVAHWATWERGSLDLRRPGTTFVRGLNHDAGGTANGSGKSSFFNALHAMAFGEHQLIARSKLKSLTRDHTRIRQQLLVDDRRVVADMRGTRMTVTEDGRLVRSREKAGERQRLLEIMGMSQELWSSTVHVNGLAGNPLVRGISKARCEFLENAFDLNRWGAAYAAVGDRLAVFRRVRSDLDAARADLARLGEPVDVEALEAEARDLREAERRLDKALREVREALAVSAALPPRPRHDASHYEEVVDRLKRRLAAQERDEGAEERWREAAGRVEDVRRRLRDVPDLTPSGVALEQLRERLRSDEEQLREYHAAAEAVPATRRWFEAARDLARRHGIRWRTPEQLRQMCASWADNLSGDHCSVCGGDLRDPVDEREVGRVADLLRLVPRGELVLKSLPPVDHLERAVREARGTLEREEAAERAERERRELRAELRGVIVPPRPRPPESRRELQTELDQAQDALHAARQWEGVRGHRHEDASRLQRAVDEGEPRLREARDRLRDVGEVLAVARSQEAERERLVRRVDELEGEVRAQPAYQALHAAYSPTGMRLWLLSELLEALVGGLNDAARTMRDRVEFGYRLSRNRDLTLTATNVSGTFDVRLMSGAEGCMFCLNLLTVLLPLLPARRRCSMLVLDELDANCDRRTRDVIAREYLPRLAGVVESLYVITPHSVADFCTEGASGVLVEKRGGRSTLREM